MDIHKVTKYQFADVKDYEWWEYSLAHIEATTCLANKLKELEDGDGRDAEKSQLLLPILFNIRHVIELFLKTLTIAESRHRGKLKMTHDLSELFAYFSKLWSELPADHEFVKEAAEVLESTPEEFTTNFTTGLIAQVETIVNKYNDLTFLTDGKAKIVDDKNELFRYPSSITGGYKLDIDHLSEKIKADEILSDVHELWTTLYMILFLFGRCTDGKRFWDGLDEA